MRNGLTEKEIQKKDERKKKNGNNSSSTNPRLLAIALRYFPALQKTSHLSLNIYSTNYMLQSCRCTPLLWRPREQRR